MNKRRRSGAYQFLAVTGYLRHKLHHMMPVDFVERWQEETGISLTATTPVEESPFEPVDLSAIFESGQPDCLYEGEGNTPYRGQEAAKRRATVYIEGMQAGDRCKFLLTGPAGTGKTTLARILGRKIQLRHWWLNVPMGGYYELLPAQVHEKGKLDLFFRTIVQDPYATVFVDEVHTLTNIENLFHVLHDTGNLWYPMADGSRLEVPKTISWIFATTDKGEADKTTGGALLRRMQPELRLEPPTKDDLIAIATDQASHDGVRIHPEAAAEMAERSTFPWEMKLIYGETKLVARVNGSNEILPEHAEEAFEMMKIDPNGLNQEDRDVIRALLSVNDGKGIALATKPDVVRYRMDEASLCSVAGVDRETYRKKIKPKLIAKDYLIVLGGQCLTDKALREYGWLAA